jgi:hypothetical protein
MKKQLSFTVLTIVLLAVVLISLSCNGTQPANNTAVTNNTSVQSSSEQSILNTPPDCKGNPSDRLNKVGKGVEANIKAFKDKRLSEQYGKNFMFKPVIDAKGNIEVYIWGKVYITDELDVDVFNGAFKSYMLRQCVSRIIFKKAPETSPTPTLSPSPEPTSPAMPKQNPAITSDGFEFIACESPNELCPDGSCRPEGTCGAGTVPTPIVNPNTNTNMNSNVKTNVNN